MGTARVALASPRAFVMGGVATMILIASGFTLALLATGQVGATHDDSGTYHACVSSYTGSTRIMRPGQAPNCTAYEFPVELSSNNPAANLTFTERTVTTDPATVFILGSNQIDCLAGETAISGGSRLVSDEGLFSASVFRTSAAGPVGSPPTGWQTSFVLEGAILPGPGLTNPMIESWVLCVS